MVSKGRMGGWGTTLMGKVFMGANLEWRHDQLCKRLEGIGGEEHGAVYDQLRHAKVLEIGDTVRRQDTGREAGG